MKIPVYSSTIRRSEMDAVLTRMVEEKIGPGEMNRNLINLVSEIFSSAGAAAFRSPSIALNYALKALDIMPPAGIIISALAPAWQYIELKERGYTPIIADVSQDTAVVSSSSVEEAVSEGGRVLILHEPLGVVPQPEIFLNSGIPVIEDISQSAGAVCGGIKAGTFGAFAILGLEEKDILTGGGGGVLIAGEKRNAAVLKRIYEEAPFTSLLPDINAALAFVQLKQMNKNIAVKNEMYSIYKNALLQGKHKTIIGSEVLEGDVNPVYSFPVILNSAAPDIQKYAAKKNVEIEFAFKNTVADFLPEIQERYINAASLLLRCILFPLYPRLGLKKASEIAKLLSTLP